MIWGYPYFRKQMRYIEVVQNLLLSIFSGMNIHLKNGSYCLIVVNSGE